MKVAVVYWSGTGNTEIMAQAVAEGAKEKGAEATLFTPDEFNPSMVGDFDSIALGCAAMGDEVLEEGKFQPMYDDIKDGLKDKKVALFGSYGWGDGQWMRDWEDDCASAGIKLATGSVMCNYAPDDAGTAECKELGAALAV